MEVHIGRSAWRDRDKQRATWQLAHECVHLLDPKPHKPYGNALEEGLATWFQLEPRYHESWLHFYIARNSHKLGGPYAEARGLVATAIPFGLIRAVRKARSTGARIGDMNPDDLAPHLPPGATAEYVERLCGTFDYDALLG